MKIQSGISSFFICLALLSAQVVQAQKPVRQRDFEKKINTEELSSIRGNLRISAESGYPLAVYNPDFAVAAAAPETMARQYLQANMDLFGLKPADLQNLRLHAVRESAAGTTVRLRQFWKNVPVYGAEITITINPQHKVNFVMNGFRYKVDLANVTPTLSAAQARQIVLDYLNVQGKIIQEHNDLIIFQHEQKAGLYYRVNITSETPQGDWEAYVDAKTGAFLKIEDIACYHHDHAHGTPGKPAPPVLVGGTGNVFRPDPLSSATATYGAGGYVDGVDANTTDLNNQMQSVALQDITFDGTNYKLEGPWASIVDFESPNKGLFAQPTSNWNFNRADDAFEAVSCYYHIDLSMRHLNVTLGLSINPYQYAGGVRVDPSGLSGADNSHYLGGSGQLAFGEGGVDDAEDADVIWHELGHGLHDWFTSGGLSQVNGLSEGCGDYWAASYSRAVGNWTSAQTPYNWMFNWDGHNPFWGGRITNYSAVYPGGLIGAIHTDGQIWATAMMQVWDAVGRNKSDKAFWSGLSMTSSSTNQNDAANAVFQAAISLGYTFPELTQIRNIFVARGYTIPALPAVKYVKANASGANNGTSWTDAYTSLQSAIDASVAGDEIWVAAGTYFPSKDRDGNAAPADPRTKTFFINKDLKIYGGFAGHESSLANRPTPLAASILSGDLGTAGINTDNAYHCVFIQSLSAASIFDGFTLQNGNANHPTNGLYERGGGMFCWLSTGNNISNCTFTSNLAFFGGGIACESSTPVITNCRFSNNTASNRGGGLYTLVSDALVYNCTFTGNSCALGSGIFNESSAVQGINCSLSGNTGSGGAIANLGSTPVFTNTIVWGNTSQIANFNGANPTITYCIIQGGYAGIANSDQNPLFVSSSDLHLQSCSPAIDLGNDGANTTTDDPDFNARKFEAVPGGAQIDRGAYEYQSTVPAPVASCKNISVNLNGSGTVSVNASTLNNTSTGCGLGFTVGGNTSVLYNCANTGSNSAILTVTDLHGRTSTCNALVTVSDVTPPSVTCKNASVNLNAAGTASITTADVYNTGSDNCGTVNQVSVTPNSFACANTGANTVTLTVNDGKGNTNTCTATVTVSDVTPPSVTCKNAGVNLNAAGAASITTADVYNTGSDNCGTVNQVSVTPNSFACANTGPNTVTLTVNDGKGNNNTCTAVVTVSDVTPPSVTCKNASVNLNAAGTASITTADVYNTGSDNCGTVNQVSVTPNSFSCANTGANTVTLTVNDGKGNTNTCTATVTVSDVTPPSVTCKNASVNLDAAGAASITTADVYNTGSDNCGTVNQVSVTPNSFACANTGPNTVTLTVNDGKGNTNTCTATVTVSDVTPPSVTCKNASVNLNAAGTASITTADVYNTGSDNCGTVNQVSVTPNSFACANTGPNTVTLTVNDGKGNNNTCTATVTVSDVTPPSVTCKNASVNLNAAGAASITTADVYNTGSDNCGTVNQVSVTPNSFTCANTGANTVTLTVNDGKGNNNTCTATVTVSDVTPPSVTCKNASVNLNAAGTVSITTADVFQSGSDNCGVVNQVSVTPNSFTCANTGANTVTLTVNDGKGNNNTCTATVTVSDVTPPTVVCKNATVNLSAAGTVSITTATVFQSGSDNCGVVNQVSVTPNSFTCANIGTNTVTLTVNDGKGNNNTCTATVTVADVTAPTVVCQNATAILNAAGTATITTANVFLSGADNCGTVNQVSVTPNTFACANVGPNTVTLTVNDGHGNTATCTATVTVVDNIAPKMLCQPATIQLNAAGQASLTPAQVNGGSFDNCSISSLTVAPNTFTCANQGANTVTLTGSDPSNNTATCTAVVTVVDLIAPVAVCKAASVVLGSNGTYTIPASLINNGSSDNCSFTLSVLPAVVTCANIGITTVTLRATDGNGNTSTCTAQVTVRDVTGPNALCKNPTVFLNDEGRVTITAATVDNGSNDPCGILSRTINFTQFNCSNIATPTVVTLTVKDIYNNTSTCLSTVTVKDNLAPTAVCEDATVTLNAAGKVTVYGANLANNSFDNCSVWSYTPIAKIYTAANIGANNLTITVKDWSGNAATCVSVVTVMPYNSSISNDDRSNQAENAGLDLRLYPNPTAGEAVLAFELPEDQDYNLQVVDMTGRVIMRQKQAGKQGENNTLLESNNWPSGVYLIRIESGGVQAQKRLVVVDK